MLDDSQINAKGDFNGTNMSKIEPIDDDQDCQDAETTSEAANFKDDDGSTENGNIDDTEKEAIDSKPILGSLNNISSNIDGDETTNVCKKQCKDSDITCSTDANDTNLNETDEIDKDGIESRLGKYIF